MTKQAEKTCSCGQTMDFPDGEIRTTCLCGCVWELDEGGLWFTQMFHVRLRAKASTVISRAEKYASFPQQKKRKRK